jgi:16S rRNA processing protein RimM
MADRMVVGRIRSPYGVQGWVWMDSFTNDPASVFEWTPWVLKRAPDRISGRPAIERIETAPEVWKLRDKGYVARLVGFPDRTSVESLVNCLIEVDKNHLPQLSNDEFYWRDLEGCRVITLNDVVLGVVKTVLPTGANDVLVVGGDAESIDRKERLIPFISQTVLEVNLAEGAIRVDWDPEF